MKILNFHVENIKRIKVADITPKDNVIIVEGKNGQGKTSVLDSIVFLLCGEKMIPSKVVRDGSETAEITADVGDVIVSRRWKNPFQSVLEIRSKADGSKIKTPQSFLDEKIASLSFDPLQFIRKNSKDRVEELKKIPGLDTSKEEAEIAAAMETRKDAKKDLDRVVKALSEIKVPANVLRSVAVIQAEIKSIEESNAASVEANKKTAEKKSEFEVMGARYKKNEAEIADIKKQIEVLNLRANTLTSDNEEIYKTGKVLKKEIEAAGPEKILFNTAPLREELTAAASASGIITRRDELTKEKADFEADVKKLDKEISAARDRKAEKVAAFKLPVPGLEITESDLLFGGIPFDNLSGAEKIRVAVFIAAAQNPAARIIRLTDGSLLDSEMMKAVEDFARESDFQIWIERVSNTPSGNSIFLEDGEIKAGA